MPDDCRADRRAGSRTARELVLTQFDHDDAWRLGLLLVQSKSNIVARFAILTVIAARDRDRHTDPALIPLTFNEIRRLFARLITNTIHTIDH